MTATPRPVLDPCVLTAAPETAHSFNVPTFPGLTLLGQASFSCRTDEADVTGVWRNDNTGKLYYADDCDAEWMPVPNDDLTREDLIPCTVDELQAHLDKRLNSAEWIDDRATFADAISALMDTVRKVSARPDTATLQLPGFPGLTLLGQVNFACHAEEVDLTGVWRDDATGKLYSGSDYYALWMGVPSRSCLEQHELVERTPDDVEWYLNDRLARVEGMDDHAPCIAAIAKLMDVVRTP
ncbi:hypothetical protein [Streptosporangium lutulentum]|uniref:Uncharacterized protein n=1 Tax=Streptosporangium lutulentum TaxID=1461250 RepID=A0ABT9QAG1_9ACTN|nr:hypothetical protein [Streptosporangium lutulentum]MDP9843288.1 hypothetical protein [Streptosporangium lutulentum]